MGNLPSKIESFPTPTPNVSQSMSPEELERHRSQIGFEVEVVLQGYWQTDLDPRIKAGVMADWADELEDWPVPQVKWALREWRRENPRRKPNPGDILGVLKKRRGEEYAKRRVASQEAQPPRETMSPEQHAALMDELEQKFPGIIKPIPEVKE